LIPFQFRKGSGWGHRSERGVEREMLSILLQLLLIVRITVLEVLLLMRSSVLGQVVLMVWISAGIAARSAKGGPRAWVLAITAASGTGRVDRVGTASRQSIDCFRIATEDAQILDEEGDFLDVEGDTNEELQAGLLLDVVVSERPAVLQLFTSADEALELLWDALFVVHLLLYGLHCVAALHLEGNRAPREGLDEDLHFRTEVWL
jgi:hypothetical protein